jgi:hypothetical protein
MNEQEQEILESLENPENCLSISLGNSKLRKTSKKVKEHLKEFGSLNGFIPRVGAYRVASFNLPAGGYEFLGKKYTVCPGAGKCFNVCYAQQGTFRFKGSIKVRILNHQALLHLYQSGVSAVVESLDRLVKKLPKTVAVVRLHDSGDFFSKWYVKVWLQVIRDNPEILFYVYTKSHPMFAGLSVPSNLRITSSYGGIWDDKITGPSASILSTVADRIRGGYVDGNESDKPAILGVPNIGLVYHGGRNLTEVQKETFSVGVRND